MATYVNDLRLTELATGEGSGTWGTTTNQSLELIGEALGYATQQAFGSDADATTTVADGASDPARAMYYKITSAASLTATRTLTIAPNTISRVMFIENATSGSQSIAISQGSGANVTIATGKTAVVYLDGAGATAAVVDAMAGVDPGVTDTLTEVLVAGNTSGGTNIELSTTDKVQFRDAAIYINSSVDGQLDIVADTEIQIAATTIDINGAINASGEIIAASLDISGDVDIDGTANLDIVDIDGAVDMASTLAVGGNTTILPSSDGDALIVGKSGGSNLHFFSNAGASLITNAAGAGAARDGFQITSGNVLTEIDTVAKLSVSAAEVVVNDTGADTDFRVESDTLTHALFVEGSSGNVGINNSAPYSPLSVTTTGTLPEGQTWSSSVNMLTLNGDRPRAGFSTVATTGGNAYDGDMLFYTMYYPGTGDYTWYERMRLTSKGALITTPVAGGHAVFNEAGIDADFRVESDNNANMLFVDGGANLVGIGTGSPIALDGNAAPGLTISSNGPFICLQDANNADKVNYISNNTGVMQFGIVGDNGASGKTEVANFSSVGAIFNDGGLAANDFRVESDSNSHMLFVDAGNDKVAIRNSSAINSGALSVNGSITFNNQTVGTYNDASGFIDFIGDDDANLLRLHAGADAGEYSKIEISTNIAGSQSDAISVENLGPIVINQDSIAERDFRVESDNDANALFVNAGTGTVNVGSAYGGNSKFTVSQSASEISCYLTNTLATVVNTTPSIIYLQTPNDAAIQDGFKMVTFADQDTVLGTIATAATSTNVAYNTSSDERLKENIVDAGSQLDTLLAVKVREYDWKKNGFHSTGFIAQELHEHIPEAVTVGLEDPTQHPWSVDYGRLTPFIIKAMQEQQELIKTLEARIAALES